jgi:hypothetical protein
MPSGLVQDLLAARPSPGLPLFLWLGFGKIRRVSAHSGVGPMARITMMAITNR